MVRHIHSLSADVVSANELVQFQLSGLLGCFSDIVGQGHAVHEVEDTPMNPRKAAV
jgi:lipoprotein